MLFAVPLLPTAVVQVMPFPPIAPVLSTTEQALLASTEQFSCFYKISKRFVLRRNKECCGYGNKRSKSQKFYKFCHFYYLFSVNLQSNLFRAIHSHPAYLLRFFATTIAAVPPITRATADKIAGSEVSAFPESEEPESEEDAALPSLIRK